MSGQNKEPISITEETLDKYFSLEAPSFPGFVTLRILKPIQLRAYKQTIEEGLYFIERSKFESEEQPDIPIFRMDIVKTPHEEIKKIIDNGGAEVTTNQDGTEVVKISQSAIEEAGSPLKIGVQFTPLEVRDEKTLTLLEAFVWAAIDEAEEAGDKEKAHLIFDTAFRKIKKSDSEPTLSSMNADNEESHGGDTVSAVKEQADIQAESGLSDSEPTLFGMDTSKNIPNIKLNKIPRVHFTTDKVNNSAWSLWEGLAASGEEGCGLLIGNKTNLQINTANEADKRKGIKRLITCLIDFNELEETGIVKHLEPYDKRVYEALSSLHLSVTEETGQDCFSLNDVHYAMGETTKPNKKTREKILTSVIKLTKTHIHLDNKEEADAYKYKHYTYDASLLPAEIITARVEGQITEGVIHLFREPPLFTFARQREQITAADVKLLQIPLNKTNKNLMLDDYLRGQIKWMKNKNSKRSNKITFEDMFEQTKLTGRKEKARQKANALKLLEHYKKCGEIKSFKEVENGFVITI